jgi:cell fate regulator YaaT (PSP1 superfamily)
MIEPNPAAAGAAAEAKRAPGETHDVLEVAFKARRREYYANPKEIPLRTGDWIIVQADRGEDLGRVHHTHEWVKQRHLPGGLRSVLRQARPEDLARLEENRAKEERAFRSCKERVEHREVEMKIVDCEFQFDGNRITFFFTAEKRVDFRDLVKDLASIFRTRIELRQIGVRDESGRIGGMGTCGRELCCATWLREFEPITLKMAKDQGLSPSPSKISGACGRLKCCLRYELDFYKESAREFPKVGSRVELSGVTWEVGRVDIFHRTLKLYDDTGKENLVALEDIPTGTKLVGPTRDRRKGCDKKGCGSRGAKPGDGGGHDHGPAAPGAAGGSPAPADPHDHDHDHPHDHPHDDHHHGDEPPRAAAPPPASPPAASGPSATPPPPPAVRRQLDGAGRGRRRRRGRRDRGGGGQGGTGGAGGPSGGTKGGPANPGQGA